MKYDGKNVRFECMKYDGKNVRFECMKYGGKMFVLSV